MLATNKKPAIGRKIIREVVALRKMMGLSIRELSNLTNGEVSTSTIKSWEGKRDVRHPRYSTVVILLEAMGHELVMRKRKMGRNW